MSEIVLAVAVIAAAVVAIYVITKRRASRSAPRYGSGSSKIE